MAYGTYKSIEGIPLITRFKTLVRMYEMVQIFLVLKVFHL